MPGSLTRRHDREASRAASVAALILHAPTGDSVAERLVAGGRWASLVDLVALLCGAGVDDIAIVTPQPEGRIPQGASLRATADKEFSFAGTLREAASSVAPGGVLYFGSGSGGLLSAAQIERLVDFARGATPAALFNNYYSCDFAALAAPRWLETTDLPAADNALGFAAASAGIPCYALPRDASTQFDIDTPADLVMLSRSSRGGDELRAFAGASDLSHPTVDRALECLTERSALTCFIGRLSPATWSHLEREVACRTSALSEGRGMRSIPSRHLPWVQATLEREGPATFFRRLRRSADAAWIDTRPLLERTTQPSAADRFASDLFRLDNIVDPVWRAFTEEAASASFPVVLGGHGIVAGDLYLACEACWKGRELPRRLHPQPFSWTKESS